MNKSTLSTTLNERLRKALDKEEKAVKEVEMWEALIELANKEQKKLV